MFKDPIEKVILGLSVVIALITAIRAGFIRQKKYPTGWALWVFTMATFGPWFLYGVFSDGPMLAALYALVGLVVLWVVKVVGSGIGKAINGLLVKKGSTVGE